MTNCLLDFLLNYTVFRIFFLKSLFLMNFSLVVKQEKTPERPRQRPCQGPQEPVCR